MNRKFNIRTRIFFVIFIMLLLTFSLIGFIFNVAASRYIYNSAVSQLERSREILQDEMRFVGTALFEIPREIFNERAMAVTLRRNDFRIEASMFVMDNELNLLGNHVISDRAMEIYEAIREGEINIDGLFNRRINTLNGTFYVSSHHLPIIQTNESAHWVIYVDITGLSNFASEINLFLIVLVLIMFVVAVFVAFFLSSSITQPIQKLGQLALNIGRGEFTSIDYRFMDREFEDLNMLLNKSAKQLDVYDAEQKTFFQNVSHELRTPLMSIQCYAEGIQCGLMEPKNASETILFETQRLTEMVKDLLYISKIDNITTNYSIERADLAEIIMECIARHKVMAEARNLAIVHDFEEGEFYIECTAELISRAVENLLSNAIRYAVSEINISCRKTNAGILIMVRDDGEGISEDLLPHIYERFYKGEGGNHGIGLSIVKSIVEQHGGNIRAENVSKSNSKDNTRNNMEGRGALFTITLPFQENRT